MTKLHELLAAEKTPTAAWNHMLVETRDKFKKRETYFDGHTKSLRMLVENPQNEVTTAQAREDKPVTTTVYDTLEYIFEIFGRAEDLQAQKNATNRKATATVMFRDDEILKDLPVDELLGLEARLKQIGLLFQDIPTLDASKEWVSAPQINPHAWESKYPDKSSKTEKTVVGIVLVPQSVEHPAQVEKLGKDIVIGEFTTIHRSGAATALQKAEAIKRVDELLVEIKKARMRANETPVEPISVGDVLVKLLLAPLRD